MMDDHLANPFRVDSTFKVIMEESIFPRELFLEKLESTKRQKTESYLYSKSERYKVIKLSWHGDILNVPPEGIDCIEEKRESTQDVMLNHCVTPPPNNRALMIILLWHCLLLHPESFLVGIMHC